MAIVRYLVSSVDDASGFYEALGFKVTERWGPAFAILELGDLSLWLSGPQTSAAKPMPDGAQPEPGGWNRIVLTVADIEATISELRGQGVAFRNELITGPGGSQILVCDPDGNLIELFQSR